MTLLADREMVVGIVCSDLLLAREIIASVSHLAALDIRILVDNAEQFDIVEVDGASVMPVTIDRDSIAACEVLFFADDQLSDSWSKVAVESCKFVVKIGGLVPEEAFVFSGATVKLPKSGLCYLPSAPAYAVGSLLRSLGLKDNSELTVTVGGYLSMSAFGQAALSDLWEQSLAIFNQQEAGTSSFQQQIAFNCIPQFGPIGEDGMTREEHALASQIIASCPNLKCSVRSSLTFVPVFHSDSLNLWIDYSAKVKLSDAVDALSASKEVDFHSVSEDYPVPINCAGDEKVLVGRLRQVGDRSIALWITYDHIKLTVAAINRLITCV